MRVWSWSDLIVKKAAILRWKPDVQGLFGLKMRAYPSIEVPIRCPVKAPENMTENN